MPTACIYTVAVVIKEIGDNYYSHQVTRSTSDDGAIRRHTVVVVGTGRVLAMSKEGEGINKRKGKGR